jgi:ABC-type transport system involved in multi-copper enzyme maturation permease subunit
VSFRGVVRAEWTKLRSVRGWALAMLAATALTIMLGLVAASGSGTDANRVRDFVVGPAGQPVVDDFRFVHQPLSGDGEIVARVVEQRSSHEWAAAGVMIKESTQSGSSYVALMVTAKHGVHLRASFDTDVAGSTEAAPRWVRLTRSGATVTGYESADGTAWREVGKVELRGLPQTAEIGLAVMSPPERRVERQAGSTSVGELPTINTATFDNVRAGSDRPAAWISDDIGRPFAKFEPGTTEAENGTFVVTGSGNIAPQPPDDDLVQISLTGVFAGLVAIVAVAALFVTSEYRRGMIRTTFTASPRRWPVLAAKALVIGAASFVAGLVGSVIAFLLAQPILRGNGFAPPAFTVPTLAEWPVLRAVVGTAAFLAVLAVFSLGAGTVLRRSAGAITLVIALVLVPSIVSTFLPINAARTLMLTTPAGGLAIQRSRPPTDTLVEPWSLINPWVGFGVLCLYAAVALGLAFWVVRRRDA